MKVRKLHLYGELAEEFGAEHEVAAQTIGEALRIVGCNHAEFLPRIRRGHFHVAIGSGRVGYHKGTGRVTRGSSKAQEVLAHQYAVPRSNGDWHLVPALVGSKSRTLKTVFTIIAGGALLATGIGGAVAAGTGGLQGALFGASTGFLGLSYGTVTLLGAGLFLGGLSQILAPTPKTDTSERKPTAFSFDGPGERDDEGGPIPIIIGEVITGGIRIASSIETTAGVYSPYGNPFGDGGYVPGGSGSGSVFADIVLQSYNLANP